MKKKMLAGLAMGFLVLGIVGIGNAATVNLTEGFENTETLFTYSSAGSVPYDTHNAETSHSGDFSFKANPSFCGASCFDSYRVDLQYTFSTPTMVEGIGFWAKEGSTSGYAWGGKMKVGHNSTWDLNWWGVVGNGQPITGNWQYMYVPINDMASSIDIRIWDITSKSSMWLDDIQIVASPVPIPSALWLFGSGLASLAGTRIRRKTKK